MPNSLVHWWTENIPLKPSVTLVLLALILAAGLGLRLHGLNWDSGYGFHPDERSIYMRAGCMYNLLTESPGFRECIRDFPETQPGIPSLSVFLDAERSPLNPHWFPLGSVLIYVVVFLRSIIELFADIGDLDMRYVGRVLSALADSGTVLMVFVLGRRMFNRNVGLLAAALTALAVVHVQNSHFYRPETFSVFFILLSFWGMLRLVEHRRLKDSLLLGVLVGLAMTPKLSVLPLVLPLALAYGYWMFHSAGGSWADVTPSVLGRAALHAGLAGVCALLVFFVLTPYALLDFSTFMADLAAQANMARQAGLWPFTIQYVDTPAFLYQIRQTTVWGLGIPLGVVAWLSIPFTVFTAFKYRQTRMADLLLLSWVVPQFVFLETFEVHFLRYVFPLMPFMILMGARMLLWLVEYGRQVANKYAFAATSIKQVLSRQVPGLAAALVVLVLATTAFYSLAFQRVYANQHPAVAASEWMQQSVPAGTKIISDNHWDEFVPGLRRYDLWQFPAYEPDTADKMTTLAGHLAESEYLLFYSYRPFVSVSRDPERFPFSTEYYQQLFAGELGYRLERSFTSFPRLMGVSFQDSPYAQAGVTRPIPVMAQDAAPLTLQFGYADDNVVGYDHPQILLFRNVERLPEAALLGQIVGPRNSQQSTEVGLLLTEEARAKQRGGGTWSNLFNRNGWTNRFPVLPWLLAIELVYLAALPLAVFIFRPLPDRGIILARILGLLLVGYVTWLLVSLGWLDFSRGSILLGLLVVAAMSAIVLTFRWREVKDFLAANWRLLATGEALFLVAFLAFVLVRAANPDLWHPFRGGEKPMELAYLNAVVRSTAFPPYDPWYAGGYLNYYYWGYYLLALPIRLTGIVPTTAFNLAVPLFFALTVTGAFSVVYNLAEGVRRTQAGSDDSKGQKGLSRITWSPVSAGLLAGLFIAVIGNLDGVIQLVQGTWLRLFGGAESFPAFDFWRSSRMIPPLENFEPSPLAFWLPEKVAGFNDVSFHITEFPFFTFLFADLHAHMMVMPFSLLVVGLGLNLAVGLRRGTGVWVVAASVVLALALGSLWVINSWDYPSYVVLALALAGLAVFATELSMPRKAALLAALGSGVVAVSVLAFLPFHQVYETFDAGVAASKWLTPLDRYLAIHGLFLFIAVTYLLWQTGGMLMAVFNTIAGRYRGDPSLRLLRQWQALYVFLGFLLAVYLLAAGYWTASVLTVLLALTGLALWEIMRLKSGDRLFRAVPVLLLGMALAIGFGVDFVRLEGDIGRMNTLFKLYLEAWTLFSLAAAFMLWYLGSQGLLHWHWDWTRAGWVGILLVLLASSLIYPVLGTKARVADRFTAGPLTLDGSDYLRRAVHNEEGQPLMLKSDLAGIQWLQDNVTGSPVVLEAHNEQYHWSARIANYTGLPTVIGWPWHQIQQRYAYADTVRKRAAHVAEIYNTTDLERAGELLDDYQIEYVVIGGLERAYYQQEGLDKFEEMVGKGLAMVVFDAEGMKIYRVL